MQHCFNDGLDLEQQSVIVDHVERIRRCSLHKNDDIWSFYKKNCPNVRTLGDALHEGYVVSNDGPCVGVLRSFNNTHELQWLSYSTVMKLSRYMGSYLWTKNQLIPNQSKVAIISSNRPEYLFVEQGCYMYGLIVVSLYTTYDREAIQNILLKTGAEILVLDNIERIRSFQDELLHNDQIKQIIVMDEMHNNDEYDKVQSMATILKSMDSKDVRERPEIDPESIATLLLTSGTTGTVQTD